MNSKSVNPPNTTQNSSHKARWLIACFVVNACPLFFTAQVTTTRPRTRENLLRGQNECWAALVECLFKQTRRRSTDPSMTPYLDVTFSSARINIPAARSGIVIRAGIPSSLGLTRPREHARILPVNVFLDESVMAQSNIGASFYLSP